MTETSGKLKYFPAFMDLSGQRCLVVGAGALARGKARLLLSAGADVHVLTGECDLEKISDYALVIAASGDAQLDARVARAANKARRPVNVVDRTDLCTFIMPAIVQRGDVVIGISTGGASPVLARNIRARIEGLLPARIGALAAFARAFREAVKATFKGPERKSFWEHFFNGSIASDVLAGRESQAREKMVSLINRAESHAPREGQVHIVGAGPGDPDLLTLRAVQLLRDADVVLYDKLVGPQILDYVRRDATRIFVGKSRAHHTHTQDEINALIICHASAGARVVRLKGGDPFVFGRGGEELEAVRRAGIAVDVVPGITAATGCAAAVQIPLTHRDHAQAVTFVTGHGPEGVPDLDWKALAYLRQTLVIYMGASNAGAIAARLITHGLDGETPVAVIENGTLPAQKTVTGALEDLPALMDTNDITGPALLVVGAVAALDNQMTEFLPETHARSA